MIGLALRMDLRRSRTLAFWLGVVVVGYVGVVAMFYPVLRDNAQAVEDYLKLFPKEFMAAFGMSGRLDDPGVFVNTYVASFLWPVVAAVGGIFLATRPSAADAERGWLDLTLGTPLPRTAMLGAAIAGQAVILVILAFLCTGTVLVLGLAVGAPFVVGNFLLATLPLAAFALAIAGVATLLGVLTLSRGRAAGICAGILLAMYLANIAGQVQPAVSWLTSISAFHYLDIGSTIDTGTFPAGDIAVFAVVAVLGWGLALWRFRTRDLLA